MVPNDAAMRLALDLVPQAVAHVGADLRYRWVNSAYARLVRRREADLLAASLDVVLGAGFELFWPRVSAVLAGHAQSFTIRRDGGDDEALQEVVLRPVHSEAGQVESFLCLYTEVDDGTISSAGRAREEEVFSDIFSAVKQGFALHEVIRDAAGVAVDYRYLAVNPAFAEMTGVPRERWLGRTLRDVFGQVDPFWIETFGNVARDGKSIHLERRSEELGATFEVFAYPAGRDRFAVITRDVTAARAREEALQQAQRLESLGVLAGGIAHDFNNILAAVLGNVNIAQLRLPPDHPVQQNFETMERGLLRARDLVRQLLAYSGRGRSERRPVDLGDLVRSISELIRVSVSRRVALNLDVVPGLTGVVADDAQLQQLVLNLVTNASEAIGSGTGTVALRVEAEVLSASAIQALLPGQGLAPGRYVRLTVSDDGCGMPESVSSRMFEPFFSNKAAGRGLGLSAIRGILTSHRAGFAFTSAVGQGTTFRVWIPGLGGDVVLEEPAAPLALPPGGVLLFIDDESLLHETIPAMVRELGIAVDTARTGEEAIVRLEADPARYRFVLLDLTMPGLGGAATLPRLKAICPALPVLLCSGDRGRVEDEGIPAGAPFLAKPFTLSSLRAALAALTP